MWEESPIGTWTLEVWNDGRSIVELKEWSIAFLGTETAPQPDIIQDKIDVPTKVTTPTPPPPPPIEVSVPAGGVSVPVVPPVVVDYNVAPKIPEQNIGDVTSSSSAAEKSNPMENCLEQSEPDWCAACVKPFVQLNGRCEESCPKEGYYKGLSNRHEICVPCYYSCETCSGPNDYEVIET